MSEPAATAGEPAEPFPDAPPRELARKLLRNPAVLIGGIVLALLTLISLLACGASWNFDHWKVKLCATEAPLLTPKMVAVLVSAMRTNSGGAPREDIISGWFSAASRRQACRHSSSVAPGSKPSTA
jgi:hypothetical protein